MKRQPRHRPGLRGALRRCQSVLVRRSRFFTIDGPIVTQRHLQGRPIVTGACEDEGHWVGSEQIRSGRMTEDKWMRPLSLQERQVSLLIAEGLTNREIAERLGLSVFTVRNQVGRILRKLNAKNRSQIAFAVGRRS